jgi:Tfp pilus assembly protein PilF
MSGPEIGAALPVKIVPTPTRRRRWHRFALAAVGIGALVLAGWLIGRHAWAASHVRAAEQALRRGEFTEALEQLEQSLRIGSDSVSIRLRAAQAARRAQRYERAEEHLSVCEAKGARMETALERILLRAQQGDLAETERPLRRLIAEGHPDTVLILEALGRGYLATMRLGNALAMLSDLIKRDPEHPWAYFWRAGLYETLHRTAEALPDYRRAMELAPRQGDFRLGLALTLLEAGQLAEAGPHFEELLRQSPKDPRVLLGVARYYRACAQPARALEYLDALVSEYPQSAEAWAQRGRAYRDQGNSAEAIRCLRKAFDLQPRSYAIGFDLYTELYGQGQIKEAKVIEKRVEHQKKQEKEVERLLKNLEQDRNSASLKYEIGMVYLRDQVDKMALHWFESALQSDPAHRPTHKALAEYYQREGNEKAAAFHRQRAGMSAPPASGQSGEGR